MCGTWHRINVHTYVYVQHMFWSNKLESVIWSAFGVLTQVHECVLSRVCVYIFLAKMYTHTCTWPSKPMASGMVHTYLHVCVRYIHLAVNSLLQYASFYT